MKPLMLTLAGFRSFRAQQTIDFSQLGLFAIVGDTGAGKSSILEAIVYALYNKTTWSERDVKQLIALDTDAMRVDFEFTVREGTFRITRAAWRGPRPPIHALRSIVDSGYRFDGEAAVGEEVRRLTGMDYGTFIKTVVMPQGRFADLLTANDGERTRVLGELLGMGEIDALRASLETPFREAGDRCTSLRATLQAHGDDPAGRLASLRAELISATTAAGDLDAASQRARELVEAMRAADHRTGPLDAAEDALSALGGHVARLEALTEAHASFESAHMEQQSRLGAARVDGTAAERAAAELRTRGLDVASLHLARTTLDHLRRGRGDLMDERSQHDRDELALSQREHELVALAGEMGALEARVVETGRRVTSAQLQSATDRQRLTVARAAWNAVALASSTAEKMAGVQTKAAAGLAQAHVSFAAATVADADASAQQSSADEAFDRARRADLAASLAHGLHAGEACPICARPLPNGFLRVENGDLETARSVVQQTEQLARQTRAAVARYAERVTACTRAENEAVAAVDEAAAHLEAARASARSFGVALSSVNEDEALAEMARASEASDATLETARDEASTMARRRAGHEEGQRAAVQTYERDRARLAQSFIRTRAAELRLEEDVETLPAHLRPRAVEEEEIASSMSALEQAMPVARTVDERARVTTETLRLAERSASELQQRRARNVDQVCAAALAGADQTLRTLATNPEVTPLEMPPTRLAEDVPIALTWAASVGVWLARALSLIEASVSECRGARGEAVATLGGLLTAVGVPDIPALEANRSDARSRRDVLEDRVAVVERSVAAVAVAAEQLAAAEPVLRCLSGLRRHLESNRFKDYVMRLRERRLLGIASEILRRMTSGRYAFAERFKIVDAQTQLTRSPQTLSGGEKFLASLALSLGLVELATRAGGRLDVLFLDEGFGSLDAHALDIALAELSARAGSGRMIGVITHVRSIAAEIETVLRVQRLAGGSVVTRLSEIEREQLIGDALASGMLEAAG